MKRAMKLTLLLICGFVLTLSAGVRAQDQVVTLKVEGSTFREVIAELKRQTSLDFFYSFNEVDVSRPVSLDVENERIDDVLRQLVGARFTWEYRDNMVIIKPSAEDDEERKSVRVKGFVYDEKKQPMPGVTVQVVGTSVGTATTERGWFAIDLPMLKGKLKFSFVGYESQEVEFTERTDTLRVYMKEEVSDLDEVVVRAYGTQKKRETISAMSTITADDIKEMPAASLAALLQGRLAGLNVIQQSGAPGSAGVIAVRGFNSLLVSGASDGQPLWVVDGVPMHSFVSPVTGTNTIADLDPSMIESVTVLKDAAAASIYGSRAGNGVILVTTKKGKEGKTQFAANASYSVAQLMEYPAQTGGRMERWLDILWFRNQKTAYTDLTTYLKYYPSSYNDIYGKNGSYDKFWGNGNRGSGMLNYNLQDSLDPYYNNCENWWKYVFRTGHVVNANIQASGGTERFRYMVGLGYYDEDGIAINSRYSRANLLTNFSAQFTKNLRLDTRIYLAYMDKSRNNNTMNNYEGLSVDPSTQHTYIGASDELKEEWLKNVEGVKDRTDDYRAMVTAFLSYEASWGLSASISGNLDFSQSNANQFSPSYLDPSYHESSSTGAIARNVMLSIEGLLHYKKSFKETHNLDLLLGINANKEQAFSIEGAGRNGASDDVYYYTPALGNDVVNHGTEEYPYYVSNTSYASDFTEKKMLSFFGRIGYNYKQRYLMEFTFRRDGSSTFGEGNRWANFPSIALGWTFSEEPFVKSWAGNWLNWGKIRGSYGTSGQVFTDAYLAHGLMASSQAFLYNVGIMSTKPISPDLTWEKTEQYDIGLDMDMFNYRLNFKLDYYYKYTSSLIYDIPLPGGLYPFTTRTENAMAVSNEGIELELQADIFREKALSWRMKFNIARNWNRFEESYSGKDITNKDLLVIGRPLSGLYTYAHEGFYESEKDVPVYYRQDGAATYWGGVSVKSSVSGQVGNYKLKDFDGDNNADMYYAGSTLPLAHGGWVNELQWKGFDLNMLVSYTIGRRMLNCRASMGYHTMMPVPKMFDYRDVRPWTEPGCDANAPSWGNTIEPLLDSQIEKVNYVSFRQLTLGYNLPDNIVKTIKLQGIRCFVTIENLFYISNYSGENPEVVDVYSGMDYALQYPLPRKWTLGLTFNF